MKHEDSTESHLISSNSENKGKTLPTITAITLNLASFSGSHVREANEVLMRGKRRKLSCEGDEGGSRAREAKEVLV